MRCPCHSAYLACERRERGVMRVYRSTAESFSLPPVPVHCSTLLMVLFSVICSSLVSPEIQPMEGHGGSYPRPRETTVNIATCSSLYNIPLVLQLRGGENSTSKPPSLNQRLRDAVRDFNLTAAEDLIFAGANVNSLERGTHATVLITACFQSDVEMVKMLLRHGAKPNLADELIMAPLHYAAGWGYNEIVDLLMIAGADPTLSNSEDLTAQDLARNRGHDLTVELLQRWIDAR